MSPTSTPRSLRFCLPMYGRITGRGMTQMCRSSLLVALALTSAALATPAPAHAPPPPYTIAKVADGDTVTLGHGQRVRIVQIDTPEVYFGVECYGHAASAWMNRLLPIGTRVRLLTEPATDRVDQYGRLLRYIVRVRDGLNVNARLVAVGAAAPYFYEGRRGKYANRLEVLARRARAARLGLWGACPHTPYAPCSGVATGR